MPLSDLKAKAKIKGIMYTAFSCQIESVASLTENWHTILFINNRMYHRYPLRLRIPSFEEKISM